MPISSKQMLEDSKKCLEAKQKELDQLKEKLIDAENELKVEEVVKIELEEKKDELTEDQKYIVMAIIENEIPVLKNQIEEAEKDIKLLVHKCSVLDRSTWNF